MNNAHGKLSMLERLSYMRLSVFELPIAWLNQPLFKSRWIKNDELNSTPAHGTLMYVEFHTLMLPL